MTNEKLAKALRYHDWTACMSDDGRALTRARTAMSHLKREADGNQFQEALIKAAEDHFFNFTWGLEEGEEENPNFTKMMVNDLATAFVQRYIQAHGERCLRSEAAGFTVTRSWSFAGSYQ